MAENIVEKYRRVRKGNEDFVLLEGVHAFKHALRFFAVFEEIIISESHALEDFEENVLRDSERDYLLKNAKKIPDDIFDSLIPYKTRSKVLAIAKSPKYNKTNMCENKPLIFLEDPANPENIGMAMRVAAAYGAGGLIVSGVISPYSASVLRAGAGLIFALPVVHIKDKEELRNFNRVLVVADPEGKSIREKKLPRNSIIIFGTEREGVSKQLKDMASQKVKLDMQENVSSLNLATSVSAFLYSAKFE